MDGLILGEKLPGTDRSSKIPSPVSWSILSPSSFNKNSAIYHLINEKY